MNLVQIGANRGADHVFRLINDTKGKFDKIILVEPIPFVLDELRECYNGIDNVIIESCVISTCEDEYEQIHFHHGTNYEVSTLDRKHLLDHGCPDDIIESIKVPNMSVNKLFEKYNILNLDYLFIDAEGFDADILMSIDFKRFCIGFIQLEIRHSDGVCKRGEKFKILCRFLDEHDYEYYFNDTDLIAKKRAFYVGL